MSLDPARLVRLYGLVLGAGLLLEGGLLLLVDALGASMPSLALPFATGDARHNTLHVAWGVAILALLATSRTPQRATLVALVFGAFYTGLAVAGVLVDRPFGLLLGPGENAFHFVVGPLALGLGVWNAAQAGSSSSNSDSRADTAASAPIGSGSAERVPPR